MQIKVPKPIATISEVSNGRALAAKSLSCLNSRALAAKSLSWLLLAPLPQAYQNLYGHQASLHPRNAAATSPGPLILRRADPVLGGRLRRWQH